MKAEEGTKGITSHRVPHFTALQTAHSAHSTYLVRKQRLQSHVAALGHWCQLHGELRARSDDYMRLGE